MISLITILSVVAHTFAYSRDCFLEFPTSGLTKGYNETIAHAIHSMTIQGLQLFYPKVPERNFVPTVNQDISLPHLVLHDAPDDSVSPDFATHEMGVIDKILTHLGNNKDGLGPNWSAIERVTHAFHMWDVWVKITQTAWKQVDWPPKQVCECLVHTDKNGIKDAVLWVAEHYKFGTPITLLNRPIPKLKDANSWAVWRDRLLHYYTPDALKDAAMYLKCIPLRW